MRITITADQRDALYDQILGRLSGIEDIWLSVCAENYDAARRLAVEYSDDLRLVSDDLGWGEGLAETIELTTPPDVLRRALSRHCHAALKRDAGELAERIELEESREQNQLVAQVCQRVLADLDRPKASGS